MSHNLALPFYESAVSYPDKLALFVNETELSYKDLAALARRISAWLELKSGAHSGRVGILASRSIEAYAGILGTLWSGGAYVPINPTIPEDRLIRIMRTTQMDALIVDQAGAKLLTDRVLDEAPQKILLGENAKSDSPFERIGIKFGNLRELADLGAERPAHVPEDALAYVLFTSGTTGTPKGVMIEAGSVAQFLSVAQARCEFRSTDRYSQVSELTFDASVLDLYAAWALGASVYVVPAAQLMAPGKFIRDHNLTVWFGVPSTAIFMEKMGMLKEGAFPSLRISIFAGEALTLATALAWKKAAPNSIVENFYGPTELTVDVIAQRLEDPPYVTRNRGTMAIGNPFPGVEARIVDDELRFLAPEEEGELVVAGRQVARGYLADGELTEAKFPTIDGKRWYRTGDLAYQDSFGVFHHLGRIDNQVKILGNRVELEEVEAHLREIVGTDAVAAIAWPWERDRATGIVAFHCANGKSSGRLREAMKNRVPNYMVPSRIFELDSMPVSSSSGKIDRKALVRMLEQGLG